MSKWKPPKTPDPEALALLGEIVALAVQISFATDAEVILEYRGDERFRVSGFTKGYQHFHESRHYLESRWMGKTGGANILPEELRFTLKEMHDFAKEVGYE